MIKRNPRIILRNTCDTELIQLTNDTARVLKKKLWFQAGGFCPVLKQRVKVRDTVLDHKHKLKAQESGPFGRGLVRGSIFDQVNGFEGMVAKKYKKQGLHNFIELPELLRNLADYIEFPPCPQIYIYPSEKPRAPRLMKSDYNKITKYYPLVYPRRKKIPPYPPGGIKTRGKGKNKHFIYKAKLSDKWQKLLDLIDIYIKEHGK